MVGTTADVFSLGTLIYYIITGLFSNLYILIVQPYDFKEEGS